MASGGCAKSTGAYAFLTRRLDLAEIVDPARRENTEQVFFGATVTICDEQGMENTYQIVGVDETDSARGRISWVSPLARALLKSRAGDSGAFSESGRLAGSRGAGGRVSGASNLEHLMPVPLGPASRQGLKWSRPSPFAKHCAQVRRRLGFVSAFSQLFSRSLAWVPRRKHSVFRQKSNNC
jgi:hypothetical protein